MFYENTEFICAIKILVTISILILIGTKHINKWLKKKEMEQTKRLFASEIKKAYEKEKKWKKK